MHSSFDQYVPTVSFKVSNELSQRLDNWTKHQNNNLLNFHHTEFKWIPIVLIKVTFITLENELYISFVVHNRMSLSLNQQYALLYAVWITESGLYLKGQEVHIVLMEKYIGTEWKEDIAALCIVTLTALSF